MNKEALGKEIYSTIHLTYNPLTPDGLFELRSGKRVNEYFDKFLFESNPKLLRKIAIELEPLIPTETEILAGLEMGGNQIATALSSITNLPAVFVRKKAKEYGTQKLAEGIDIKDKNLCIVEDIITTGGQVIISAKALREQGAIVKNAICVYERMPAKEKLEQAGIKLISLFSPGELVQNDMKP